MSAPRLPRFTRLFNLAGTPAIYLPCGRVTNPDHPERELPIGMQIAGQW
jgi:Asp-tRNA(Asn)/Glu-tRNA(Gln) amidotransferase A subunit family amidase